MLLQNHCYIYPGSAKTAYRFSGQIYIYFLMSSFITVSQSLLKVNKTYSLFFTELLKTKRYAAFETQSCIAAANRGLAWPNANSFSNYLAEER